ncbi:M20/M25/M40 family metallo-hydrolase [Maricaulis sp.]|jgi:Zn-dependent M28 family amino/carboxypeptidase|uniref:M20/M25/M40 family metallo-hydrolase n=1 Tax=Maricaulis sp. TaxID=1486257 RepID=UPI0026331483|nr:M20/M25/M40 family metallo-hydrolase [Maricaulis sp.]MDF1769303.1 M20/M25/M40 family metallo-hydrolase [Maricaulis sp.]
MRAILATTAISLAILATGCAALQPGAMESSAAEQAAWTLDRSQLLTDLQVLAADDMEGRAVATDGNARARAYIITRLEAMGAEPVDGNYEHPFSFESRRTGEKVDGINILARIDGSSDSDRTMVVTAHYDHVGMRDGQIWNGADDNASGVASVLAVAEMFLAEPPEHDVIIALVDAEENGLQGARAFVENPPIPAEDITFNLNMDMVAMSTDRILWAVGTYHYPFLTPIVDEVAERASVSMPMGYDEPTEEPGGDWTNLTDSGAFHAAGIPFIYLGVDFHPHYHQPTDTYENMTLDFFQDAAAAVADFARVSDEQLDMIGEASGR